MSLRQKVFNLFDVVIPEGTSDKAALRELGRRGKFDMAKALAIIFLLIEAVEELQPKEKKKITN